MTLGEFLEANGLELIKRVEAMKELDNDIRQELESIGLKMRAAAYHLRRKEKYG